MKYEKTPKAIAKGIMEIAVSPKIKTHDVRVSRIIVRAENQQLNLKAINVSNHLAGFCKKMNFSLINNSK